MKKLIAILFVSSIVVSCVKPVTPNQSFCADGHIFWGGNPVTVRWNIFGSPQKPDRFLST